MDWAVEMIGVVFFLLTLFALCVGALNWDTEQHGKDETDPCQSCLRWTECNGVDHDICDICRH